MAPNTIAPRQKEAKMSHAQKGKGANGASRTPQPASEKIFRFDYFSI
jgi:hypothetical protein